MNFHVFKVQIRFTGRERRVTATNMRLQAAKSTLQAPCDLLHNDAQVLIMPQRGTLPVNQNKIRADSLRSQL